MVIPAPKATPPLWQDEYFQDAAVKVLAHCRGLDKHVGLFTADDFKPLHGMRNGRARWIVGERVLAYYKEHGAPIGKLLRADALGYAKVTLRLGERQVAEVTEYLEHLKKLKVPDPRTIVDKLAIYRDARALERAVNEAVEAMAAGELTSERFREIVEAHCATAVASVNVVPVSAAAMFAKKLPPQKYLLNPKLPVGLCMVAAKPKVGKTWLVLALALATAIDAEFLGEKVQCPGPVAYVSLEDGERRMQSRLEILAPGTDGAEFANLDFFYSWPGFPALDSLIKQRKYGLLVVDHLMAVPRAESKSRDIVRADYASLQPFRQLAERHGIVVMLVNHLRKMTGEQRDTILGTTGITAAVDSIWTLTRMDERGKAKLQITGRDIEEAELMLQFSLGWTKVAEGVEVEAARAPLQMMILTLLKNVYPQGLLPKDIAARLGVKPDNTRVALKAMRESNRVAKNGEFYVYPRAMEKVEEVEGERVYE